MAKSEEVEKKEGEIDPKFWELLMSSDKKDYESLCREYGVTDFRWMLKKLNEMKKEREEEQAEVCRSWTDYSDKDSWQPSIIRMQLIMLLTVNFPIPRRPSLSRTCRIWNQFMWTPTELHPLSLTWISLSRASLFSCTRSVFVSCQSLIKSAWIGAFHWSDCCLPPYCLWKPPSQ